MKQLNIDVSRNTVGRLLKQMVFRLRVNYKKRSRVSAPERDKQYRYIKRTRSAFARRGEPVMSIDNKKKELVGNLKNAGVAWKQKAR